MPYLPTIASPAVGGCSAGARGRLVREDPPPPALEAAGLEDDRARRQTKLEVDAPEIVEQIGEREGGAENHHRPPLALARAAPRARFGPFDATLRKGVI